MILLGLVNANYQFMLVDFGTNGSISDEGVLQNTTFFEKLINKELSIPYADNIEKSSKQFPYVFVCDDAFPLQTDMFKPFRQSLLDSREKKIFNYRLSRAQRNVENALGILAS